MIISHFSEELNPRIEFQKKAENVFLSVKQKNRKAVMLSRSFTVVAFFGFDFRKTAVFTLFESVRRRKKTPFCVSPFPTVVLAVIFNLVPIHFAVEPVHEGVNRLDPQVGNGIAH